MLRIFLALLVIVAGATGTTAAASTTTTANASATTTTTAGEDVTVQLSETLRIVSVEFENQTAVVVFEAEIPESVVITDAASASRALVEDSRHSEAKAEPYHLDMGRTTVRFPVTTFRGESGIWVSSGAESHLFKTGALAGGSGDSDGGPFEGTSSTTGWLGGAGVSITMVALAARRIKTKDRDPVESIRHD